MNLLPLAPRVLWRSLLPWPLRLQIAEVQIASELAIELIVDGDMRARASWLFAPAKSNGTEVTCRWEFPAPAGIRGRFGLLYRFMLERAHFSRMRHCARGAGLTLECSVEMLREWSGALVK